MTIGIYDPYLDDAGGGEKYMASIAYCLSGEKDYQVVLFWDNIEDVKSVESRFSIDLSRVTIAKNIFSPHVNPLTRFVETSKFDIIIYLSDGSIPLSLSKKLLLHLQQPLDHFNERSLKGKIKLLRVSKIFCNSEYTKSYNEKRFNLKTTVLYPPVKLSVQKVKKENIILTVGRFRVRDVTSGIEDYKKFEVMIDGFKQIVNSGLKGWKFIIATSIKEEDEKQFAILEKEIHGYPIEFLVNMKNDSLWNIYSRAKIYWHAAGYQEDLSKFPERAEHFGISTVEAMGAGCVPIVINCGGQKEIVTENVNGLLWTTLSELENKTKHLINNESLFVKLSMNAQKRAKDFSFERFCEQLQGIISQ